jgi:hypothetical protein
MTPESLSELPSALARLDCSGAKHTIRWERGELIAVDHDDPEGERALVALGGTSCGCLDVLGAWSRQKENVRLLSVLSRGTQDPIQTEGFNPGRLPPPGLMPRNAIVSPRGRAQMTAWVSTVPQGTATPAIAIPGVQGLPSTSSPTFEADAVLLAGLGQELTVRMVATVTAALLDNPDSPEAVAARPALEASLFGRAMSALRMWLAAPHLDLELVVAGPSHAPGLEWDGEGPVHLALPHDWVVRVWGRDLTVIAGRFSLGIVDSTPHRTILTTVGSDLSSIQRLSVEMV